MNIIIATISGAIMGAICGLIPLLLGRKKGHNNIGTIGFISCIVSGAILGILLALPVAIVFMIVILVKKTPEPIEDDLPPSVFDFDMSRIPQPTTPPVEETVEEVVVEDVVTEDVSESEDIL